MLCALFALSAIAAQTRASTTPSLAGSRGTFAKTPLVPPKVSATRPKDRMLLLARTLRLPPSGTSEEIVLVSGMKREPTCARIVTRR